MDALTPSERRGGLIVLFLLALGAGYDLWRASRPLPAPSLSRAAPAVVAATDTGAATSTAAVAADSPPRGLVDLNRASVRELDALPGIGPVLAARIVAYREGHGRFRSREDLMGVRGIGPRLYARIGPLVVAGPGSAAGERPTP